MLNQTNPSSTWLASKINRSKKGCNNWVSKLFVLRLYFDFARHIYLRNKIWKPFCSSEIIGFWNRPFCSFLKSSNLCSRRTRVIFKAWRGWWNIWEAIAPVTIIIFLSPLLPTWKIWCYRKERLFNLRFPLLCPFNPSNPCSLAFPLR